MCWTAGAQPCPLQVCMRCGQLWLAAGLWAWQLQSALDIPAQLVVRKSFGTSSWQNRVDQPSAVHRRAVYEWRVCRVTDTARVLLVLLAKSEGDNSLNQYRKGWGKSAFEKKVPNFCVNQVTVLGFTATEGPGCWAGVCSTEHPSTSTVSPVLENQHAFARPAAEVQDVDV